MRYGLTFIFGWLLGIILMGWFTQDELGYVINVIFGGSHHIPWIVAVILNVVTGGTMFLVDVVIWAARSVGIL